MSGRPTRRLSPAQFHGGIALLLSLLGAAALLLLCRPPLGWAPLLGAWLVSVSVVTFGYYGHDKRRARLGGWRVPEVVLHGLAVAGGSLGAYAGMRAFRHKTIKGPFRIFFWFVVALQVLLVAAVVYRLLKP